MCACVFETPWGTSEEWVSGVCGWLESAGMSLAPFYCEEEPNLALFLDFGFEGDDFRLADFFFMPSDGTTLPLSDMGSKESWIDCVGLCTIEVSKCCFK